MFTTNHSLSTVTAVLPAGVASRVVELTLAEEGASALIWNARGTLLQDRWWQRYVPPISPRKNIVQMLVPSQDVDRLVERVAQTGNLHKQSTGAVFSTPCEHAYLGSQFNAWPNSDQQSAASNQSLSKNLSVIYCIVGRQLSDKVSRAAINTGAHGPVVYYTEGRGLRDRLGWLRITKEAQKELLMVIADEADVEEVFDAMAKAGDLHLPGRGFMYRLPVDKGLFNLPSRVANHRYEASTQQIIHAIDHLSGHTHWRDQSVFEVGGEARGAGLDFLQDIAPLLQDRVCLSAVVARDSTQAMMDLMLDNGATGLNLHYARLRSSAGQEGEEALVEGARIISEYGMLRCITDSDNAAHIAAVIEAQAEDRGIKDVCVISHNVPRIATYVPGGRDYRRSQADSAGRSVVSDYSSQIG